MIGWLSLPRKLMRVQACSASDACQFTVVVNRCGQLVQRLALVLAGLLLGLGERCWSWTNRPPAAASCSLPRHGIGLVHAHVGWRRTGSARRCSDAGHATRVILSLKSLLKMVRPALKPAPSSYRMPSSSVTDFGRQVKLLYMLPPRLTPGPSPPRSGAGRASGSRWTRRPSGSSARPCATRRTAGAEVGAEVLVLVHAQPAGDAKRSVRRHSSRRTAPTGSARPCVAIGQLIAGLVLQALVQVAAAQRERANPAAGPAGLQVQVLDLHLPRAVVELFLLHIICPTRPSPSGRCVRSAHLLLR